MIINNVFKTACIFHSEMVDKIENLEEVDKYKHELISLNPLLLDFSTPSCFGYFSIQDIIENDYKIFLLAKLDDEIDTYSSCLDRNCTPVHLFLSYNDANRLKTNLEEYVLYLKSLCPKGKFFNKSESTTVNHEILKSFNIDIIIENNYQDIIYTYNEEPIIIKDIFSSYIFFSSSRYQIFEYSIPHYLLAHFNDMQFDKSTEISFKSDKDPIFG